jgi:nicotinamidase-related amidase
MNTLLIIDMQNAWLSNPRRTNFDAAGVVARINHAASRIRSEGGQVIYVQHADAEASVGSLAWQIMPALTVTDRDKTVRKLACDAFSGTELAALLEPKGAGTVHISGFATEFCVDTTVRAAASRGLHVVVLADAHTTSDRPHLAARDIIAHHNWIWENMAVPAGAMLKVRPTAEAFPG